MGTQFHWKSFNNDSVHVLTAGLVQPSPKIAAYDMDGTIITTKSGRVFPIDHKDWRLLYENRTREKLESILKEGYKIVLITNQAGLATGKTKLDDFKTKVESVVKSLNKGSSNKFSLPIQLFCCAAAGGIFRKPRTAVWELLSKHSNEGVVIDLKQSFYCGDAAGRIKKASDGKKDFSCSDRLFALNIGLPFWTPEQHFLGRKTEEEYKLPEFDPNELRRRFESISQDTLMQKGFLLQGNPQYVTLTSIKLEVIMMVGVQGSGKSTLASNWFSRSEPEYVVLSNDRLGSREKTLSALRKNLKASNSCIIDNTHVDMEARKKFLEVAKEFDVPVRAFVMSTSLAHAKHNNIYRGIIDTSKEHAKIGEALMHQFKNKYQEPSLDEGFTEIVKINVVPKFLFEQHRQIYFMYLQEK